ncbi:hypothetical protein GCM10011581_31800 [Saccharopolyspora subtropica]|uniref:Uncharacterized protein n=1 Tax=Saccharopolyspora thermophila TaxID=89367 RepID=A0A917K0L9_9PSEU|nr:hypothetical protein [Saccharopolyspora subtropica]GGI92272.1 hypothetical protein GCM10011581_31800 [Saccharopolyspora subtropica]
MGVADMSFERYPESRVLRVRDLMRRCSATHHPAERVALLERMADELERAAQNVPPEVARVLRGQADMARFFAEVQRRDRARRATGNGARQP